MNIAEIRARCEAATPGRWIYTLMTSKKSRRGGSTWYKVVGGKLLESICHYLSKSDAEFIAHARTDIPDMLAEIDRLTAALAAMTAERDAAQKRAEAAERDLASVAMCATCKHADNDECDATCGDSDSAYRWEWRGPKEGKHE